MPLSNSCDDQQQCRGDSHRYRPRPTSPPKRDESTGRASRRRCSSPDLSDFSSRNGDDAGRAICRSRICHDCDPPLVKRNGDGTRKDADVQVAPDDILCVSEVQTSQSLLCRSPELPRRCSVERGRHRTPRKSWNMYADCEQRRPCRQEGPEEFVSQGIQCDPRDIDSDDSAQTGPSLDADGPFCRFDYKLKNTRPSKDQTYEDCIQSCTKSSKASVPCSENRKYFALRDGCSYFHQQVEATDIAISESLQTGEDNCWQPERALNGRHRPPGPRKVYRYDAPVDCERPEPPSKCEGTRNFTMQVKATNICPSKCCQTDPCIQPGACLVGHLYRYHDWNDCCERKLQEEPAGMVCFKNFCGQVCPMDICDCDATQTGSSLCLRKPFRRNSYNNKQAVYPPTSRSRIAYGRARNFHVDDCACPCPYAQVRGEPADNCTQVSVDQITASAAIQTCSPQMKVKKCFVRGGPWSC